MTYTEIINAVLRRLREDEIASPNDTDYSVLIGDFVKETKREVENAWNWLPLRQTIAITTAQGTSEYSVTGSGKRFVTLDVYNTTQKFFLIKKHSSHMKQLILLGTEGIPSDYYYEGVDSSGDTKVNFWSIPNGVYVVNFNLVIPQDDPTIGTEEILVDEWPIILGAYAKAIAERGEDQGKTGGEALRNYQVALGDSIALDISNTQGEDEWYV